MDAPLHVTENTPTLTGYPIWRFFGTGVAVSIPKGKWGVITAEDLERATPTIRKNDIVMINTGTHRKLADTDEYYAYSPGLYKEAAEWLVEKQVKMVGVDVQALDHPLGTKLVDHGPGPSHPHLMEEYRRETGRDVMKDFPHWEVAHKTLMVKGGIPGIENINGELDAITGKRCTFLAFPWRWPEGEGCGVRVVAILDPDQTFRFGQRLRGGAIDPRDAAQSPLPLRRARHGRRRHRRVGSFGRACAVALGALGAGWCWLPARGRSWMRSRPTCARLAARRSRSSGGPIRLPMRKPSSRRGARLSAASTGWSSPRGRTRPASSRTRIPPTGRRVMDANVRGAWLMAKAVGTYWIAEKIKGKVVLMSSTRGRHGNFSGYTRIARRKGRPMR